MLQVENKLPQDLRVEFLRPDGTVLAVPLPRGVTLVIDGLGIAELTPSAREVFVRRGHYTVREYGGGRPRPPVNWIARGAPAEVSGAAVLTGDLTHHTPAVLPTAGLALHFDAVALTGLSNGDAVAAWPDLSGNGRNGSAVGTPRYTTGALNGLPVVRFAVTDRFALSCPQAAPGSVFLVMRNPDAGGVYQLIMNRAYSNNGPGLYAAFPSAPGQTGIYWDGAGPTINLSIGALASNGAYKIAGWQWGSFGVNLWEDGAGGTISAAVKSNVDTWTSLGGDVGGSQTFHGDVGEVLIYNSDLDTATRHTVEDYLSAKWGVALNR